MPPPDPPPPLIATALLGELAAYRLYREAVEAGLWARIRTAYATGVPVDAIAQAVGLHRATIFRHLSTDNERAESHDATKDLTGDDSTT